MPEPRVVPVIGDETPPEKVDVVVIGGGIVGASAALELAERGVKVALCEKGGIGREQSSRNWGWVRISRRDPREIPLMAVALKVWDGLEKRLGRDVGYKRTGIMFACSTDEEYANHQRWIRNLDGYDLECRMMDAAEFHSKFPGSNLNIKGVLYTPVDGRGEPQKAAPAIAEGARDRGAAVLTDCAVRGIEQSAGRVSGVVTELGRIQCSSVILAGGAWSNLFCRRLSVDLPSLNLLNSVMRTQPLEGVPEPAIWTSGFATCKRQDGSYIIASGHANVSDITPNSFRYFTKYLPAIGKESGSLRLRFAGRFFQELSTPTNWNLDEESPFEYCRVLDPRPSRSHLNKALAAAQQAFPAFVGTKIVRRWAGYMDVTPDAVPYISAVDSIPGFFVATGLSAHGFGLGPGAGVLAADLVMGNTPCVDPKNFRFSRFSDGSKIELISGF